MKPITECLRFQVKPPHGTNYRMFIPEAIASSENRILQLLNVTCGREDISPNTDPEVDGYLLLVNCEQTDGGGGNDDNYCPQWKGNEVTVELTAETTIALVHIEASCSIVHLVIY